MGIFLHLVVKNYIEYKNKYKWQKQYYRFTMCYLIKSSINLGNACFPNNLSSTHMGTKKRTLMATYFWMESSPSEAHNY